MQKPLNKFLKKIFFGIVLYSIFSLCFKIYKNKTVIDFCYKDKLNQSFGNPDNRVIGKTYNFDQIFTCGDWDEVFIVGFYYDRTIGYIRTGVLIPKFSDDFNEGDYLIHFLKNNHLISSPVTFHASDFIFSLNSKSAGAIRIKRKDAIFNYVDVEAIGFDYPIYGFKLTSDTH